MDFPSPLIQGRRPAKHPRGSSNEEEEAALESRRLVLAMSPSAPVEPKVDSMTSAGETIKTCHLYNTIDKDTNINEHQNLQISPKLPKLELPKFQEDVLKRREFWERFQSSVDSRNLTKTDKMAYLVASLGQEALATVEGLDITSDNYNVEREIRQIWCCHRCTL